MGEPRYLVTGGAGFIGSALVRQLLGESEAVVGNLDKLTYAGSLESLGEYRDQPRHQFVRGDICDAEAVGALFRDLRPTGVFHLAAESHVDRSIDSPAPFVETNVVGTFTLLEGALAYWHALAAGERDRFRFLHCSTDEVYGPLAGRDPFTEESAYAPSSPYAASKAGADHLGRAYFRTYGLPVVITNSSNNYGPYQFPEKLIPLMVLNALEGRPLPVYGDGGNVRDWLYVDDHCRALQRVIEAGRPGEVYHVAGHSEHTNLDVVQAVCRHLDRLAPRRDGAPHAVAITHVPDRPGHDRRYAVDAGKIERDLGWRPAEEFETGLERTVRWYLEHRDWCEAVMEGVYRRERLGTGEGRCVGSSDGA
jgi:dTDP-glucose 4,6-dehydratase